MSEGPKQGLGGVFKAEALSIGLGRSSESIEKKKKKSRTRVEALVGRFEDDSINPKESSGEQREIKG